MFLKLIEFAMKLKKLILPILILGLAVIGIFYYFQTTETVDEKDIITKVKRGVFEIKVTATGELQAKNSEKIRGPSSMRAAGIWNTSITDLTPEGTIVKEGDYVATLDRTELDGKMKDAMSEIEQIQTQLEQAKIDTAIEMRGIRDDLVNLTFSKKEKELYVDQSRYEPQMVIQQAEIDLQKTQRDFLQLENKYELKKEQAAAKISEIDSQLKQQENKLSVIQKLNQDFIIKAPKDGMVIYSRSWNGEKKGPGSQVSGWNPTVAELPDLSDMISKTFVNEVDISRIKKGQDVTIEIDAFPDMDYTGTVTQVANIGETLKGFDSKVFEVTVQVNEIDSIMRPAMTTGNEIITDILEDRIYIPLEAFHVDSISFVYSKVNGELSKKEIVTGVSNDDDILVKHGLKEGDPIYLTIPENNANLPIVLLDESIKKEMKTQLEKEKRERAERMKQKALKVKDESNINSGEGGGDRVIIFN